MASSCCHADGAQNGLLHGPYDVAGSSKITRVTLHVIAFVWFMPSKRCYTRSRCITPCMGYAFMQVSRGCMSDRYRPQWVVMAAVVVWSFLLLIGMHILFGPGEGIYPCADIKSIDQWFMPQERGRTTAFLISWNSGGSMSAPFINISPDLLHGRVACSWS